MERPSPGWWRDAPVALALAMVMGALWTLRDWPALAALRLPDTDDAMRLQQVRDWLGGQRWGDLTQYRIGPPGGLAMHWSRLPDLPVAALILVLRPLLGGGGAEIAAVIAWPLTLFAILLMLTAAIARRLGAGAATAMLVTALAYPLTTIVLPGRIDHHGLQVALLLAAVLGMLEPPSRARGVAIGAAIVASLAVGLELVPLLAMLGGWAVLDWIRDRDGGRRLAGIGGGIAVTGLLATGLIPLTAPAAPLCDALDHRLQALLVAAGGAAMLLPVVGARWAVPRGIAALAAAIVLAIAGMVLAPQCLSGPYGAVDPLVARWWLGNVGEAQSAFAAPAATTFGYLGLLVVGAAATFVQVRRGGAGWALLFALIATAALLCCVQLRAAYAGVALAVPALAAMIAAARRRGVVAMAAAWIASAGIAYPLLGGALARQPAADGVAGVDCAGLALVAALARLPAGRIAAPIDVGPRALLATHLASLAAPYHRNNAGNAAAYRIFLGPVAAARRNAAADRVDYLLWCRGSFAEAGAPPADSLAAALAAGRRPLWLVPIATGLTGVALFRVADPG